MIEYNYFMINKINKLLNFCNELINIMNQEKNEFMSSISNYE